MHRLFAGRCGQARISKHSSSVGKSYMNGLPIAALFLAVSPLSLSAQAVDPGGPRANKKEKQHVINCLTDHFAGCRVTSPSG